MDFQTFRPWFNERFLFLLKEKSIKFSSYSESQDISEIVSYAVELGKNGKRFRPFLTYLASGLDQEEAEKHFLLFASVEMLHLFALIHDDIMDEADIRHGVICAHKNFSDIYNEKTSESVGILLGDTVFSWAYETLIEYSKTFPQLQTRVFEEFTKLVSEVTHGQMLDVISPRQKPLSREMIVKKMELKTARYSFVQPLKLGFTITDSNTGGDFAEIFGMALGIAFQMQDDLLDIVPSSESGKSSFVDIETGQQTVLSWYMLNKTTQKEQDEFASFFGKIKLSYKDRELLLSLLTSSRVKEYLGTCISDYLDEAEITVKHFYKNDSARWLSVIELIKTRKK